MTAVKGGHGWALDSITTVVRGTITLLKLEIWSCGVVFVMLHRHVYDNFPIMKSQKWHKF